MYRCSRDMNECNTTPTNSEQNELCLENDSTITSDSHDIEEANSDGSPSNNVNTEPKKKPTHQRSSSLGETSTPTHRRTQSQEDDVQVQEYIRSLSTVLSSDPRQVSADEELLQSGLRHAGECSYGIDAIEVYIFDDPRLEPMNWWFRESVEEDDLVQQPEICIPGVDLVGALWQHTSGMKRVPSMSSLRKNRSWTVSFRQQRVKKDNTPRTAFPQPPTFGASCFCIGEN